MDNETIESAKESVSGMSAGGDTTHEHMRSLGYHGLPRAPRAAMPKARMPRMPEVRSAKSRY